MKIVLGTDHAGFELKEQVKQWLTENGHEVDDAGAHAFDEQDDYPDFIIPAAKKVSADPLHGRGIVFGGSGQGEAIAANKVRGVCAALYYGHDIDIVRLSREHNNTNVLSLGARFVSFEEAKEVISLWLATDFAGGRHERRIKKLDV